MLIAYIQKQNLTPGLSRTLVNIINKIQPFINNLIERAIQKLIVIFPFQSISYEGTDLRLNTLDSKSIYKILIFSKVKLPRGLLNWCADLELSDEQFKPLSFLHTNVAHKYLI